jgi:hypothetical protein
VENVEAYHEARQMYFRYLGSSFYMNRAGESKALFDSYRVPEDVLRQWAVELKAQQLARLNQPGNWWVLNFLHHHSYLGHLADIVAQPPRGRLWERCAYLERLLKYADRCADQNYQRPGPNYPPSQLWAALEHVILAAERLLRVARAARSIDRVERIIDGARRRLAVSEDASGHRFCLWRWDPPTATATPFPSLTET